MNNCTPEMSPDSQREAALFQAAAQLAGNVRASFLDNACQGNAALRDRLEALLSAHEQTDGALAELQTALKATMNIELAGVPDETIGQKIGRYKILENVGEGGCGVVYVAEQTEPVRRRVALKVIKLGMDTKAVVARFEAERQALAMMDHPNIAKVLDAGTTETGRPYFIMELVRGIRITDYCDQNNLPTNERLGLFIKVCQAIQHAHQKGIIHRDIKPSNILVTLHDGVPVPKVIDFGIAKATEGRLTEHTVYTQLHQFIGTPAYMSPEQAEMSGLDIDTRSDIYSLGVLLYELLAGSTPFDGKELIARGVDVMRKVIREQEPVRPSTRFATLKGADLTTTAKRRSTDASKLTHQLRGDLDWIVMKCLEKDRTRRYETANGVVADLQRHLNDEPVTARPPSRLYEFQKTVRRHKFGFAAAAVLVAVLGIGVLISTWQAVRATRAERLAQERLAESEAISKFLTGVFQSPDPSRDGRTITVAESLDSAVKKMDAELAHQPAQRAMLQSTIGNTYRSLGLYAPAIPLLEKARDYFVSANGLQHTNSINTMNDLGLLYFEAGRQDEGLKLIEESLALNRKVRGSDDTNSIGSLNNLALFSARAGRFSDATEIWEDVLAKYQKVTGPESEETIMTMGNLAYVYFLSGDHATEALELQRKVQILIQKRFGPEHPNTLLGMQNLANYYEAVGGYAEALRLREEVLPRSKKVFGPDHPRTIGAMQNLAISYQQTGRITEAINLGEQAVDLFRRVNGPEHFDTQSAMNSLAGNYDRAGRTEEAQKIYAKVLALRQKTLGPEHPETLRAMGNLGYSFTRIGQYDEATQLYEELVPLSRELRGPEHPDTLNAMMGLAGVYRHSGRTAEAIELGQSSLELFRRISGPTNFMTLNAMTELAITYQMAGQLTQAIALEEPSLRLKRLQLPPAHQQLVESIENLATCYEGVGRMPEAGALRRELAGLRANANKQEAVDNHSAMPPAKP